jgi:NTP pyrophosphatase (non-canonical NTP hydrolase)
VNQRVPVLDTEIAAAFTLLGQHLKDRIARHGKNSFIGPHEILGIIDEEMDEFREAVRANSRPAVLSELEDIATGAVFGIASLIAMDRAQREASQKA